MLTLLQADLVGWQPVEPVDLVLLTYLHLPPEDRRRLIAAALSAVGPGGRLLLVAHDVKNRRDGTGGPQDPALLWQPAMVQAAGWQVVRSETAPRPVGELTAWDTVVHLRRPVRPEARGG